MSTLENNPAAETAAPSEAAQHTPRRDHRAAVQAQKLRMSLATTAVRYGDTEPSVTPVATKILIFSIVIGFVLLAGTIVASKILQML